MTRPHDHDLDERSITTRRERLSSILEVTTVGFPFCGFKLVTGLFLLPSSLAPVGVLLLLLGGIDLLLNTANLATLLVSSRRVAPACLIDLGARALGPSPLALGDLGLALDVLLSFALVAALVGTGAVAELGRPLSGVWSVCVVLNVLGAGLARLLSAFEVHAR